MIRESPSTRREPAHTGSHSALLVAITGGSGSGKSWLADRLKLALAPLATRLSLDDFYRDRSHLPEARRARLNFDRPHAIDWDEVERALRVLRRARPAHVPCYDFATHTRLKRTKTLKPTPIVLFDGLWLMRRASIRECFSLCVFVDCSRALRLRRRLARDMVSRGRSRASVLQQFRATVDPMHQRYVAPQRRYADVILPGDFGAKEIRNLAHLIRKELRGHPLKP